MRSKHEGDGTAIDDYIRTRIENCTKKLYKESRRQALIRVLRIIRDVHPRHVQPTLWWLPLIPDFMFTYFFNLCCAKYPENALIKIGEETDELADINDSLQTMLLTQLLSV